MNIQNLRNELSRKLNAARPERYTNPAWVDEVADQIALDDIQRQQAARDYVRQVARDVEGKATRSANRLMREFHKNQCLPIDWAQYLSAPIAIVNVVIVDGKPRKVHERVRLADATPTDFELWAETENAARERDYRARGESVSGISEIAALMRAAGAVNFLKWAESTQESAAA